jgi:uncharacterized membrane protein
MGGGAVRAASYFQDTAARDHHTAFGSDTFGRTAEKVARFFGTPRYIVGQSIVVALWIVFNSVALVHHVDRYPYILLNLGFSLQAAYAAPLILLAQTRQADRDKMQEERTEEHREKETHQAERRVAAIKSETDRMTKLLESNTDLTRQDKELTEQVAALTREIHAMLTKQS